MSALLEQFQSLLEQLLAAQTTANRQEKVAAVERFLAEHKDRLIESLAAFPTSHPLIQLLHQLTTYALLQNFLEEVTAAAQRRPASPPFEAAAADDFMPPAPPPASPAVGAMGDIAAFGSSEDEAEAAPEAEPALRSAIPSMEATPAADEVHFTAYYPRRAAALRRYALIVYAHVEHLRDVIARDVEKFRDELGGEIPEPRRARQSAAIKIGTPLTVMIECDEALFEPQLLTKRWDGSWLRYLFDFTAPESLIGELLTGSVVVTVVGVEVSRVKFAFEIVAPEPEIGGGVAEGLNPLAAAKIELEHSGAPLYQRIFISYSRKDAKVALVYRAAQEALGNNVFMDSYSIRAGEDWRAALARAIDEADVLQLFWSPNSAESKNVRDEYRYALEYRCQPTRCVGFIRPVYWDKPLHPPPPELAHLNFRYVPIDDIIEGTPPD